MFELGDKIRYKVDELEGIGFIAGVATSAMPILGISYIIADDTDNFPNKAYPYTHFVCPELYLTAY